MPQGADVDDSLTSQSATDLATAIRAGVVSSEEVVTAFLDRIEAVNPMINAVVQVAAESALEQARAADAAIAAGSPIGRLHGVPFTVKDNLATVGVITAVGEPERAEDIPNQDATVVARMRAAGAILLGKTNCPPGGGGNFTDNPVYGRTNNPYDLARTPGGSSGGEAAIQAAGGSPVGIGSDSGGSIRGPAHLCGIAGLKPTSGRVPSTGGFELPGGLYDTRTQIGPMSRFVRDLGPTLAIIAGIDGRDSAVVPMPPADPDKVTVTELRLAFYTDDGLLTPTSETIATVEAAARALSDAGLAVEERRPQVIGDAPSITQRYWRWDSPTFTGSEFGKLMLDWNRFRTAMLTFMDGYDALLCPAVPCPAPLHGEPDDVLSAYTLAFSLTGWPCVVVRAGTSPEGLPIGVQIAAPPWREDIALAVAQQIESALGGWQSPAL